MILTQWCWKNCQDYQHRLDFQWGALGCNRDVEMWLQARHNYSWAFTTGRAFVASWSSLKYHLLVRLPVNTKFIVLWKYPNFGAAPVWNISHNRRGFWFYSQFMYVFSRTKLHSVSWSLSILLRELTCRKLRLGYSSFGCGAIIRDRLWLQGPGKTVSLIVY